MTDHTITLQKRIFLSMLATASILLQACGGGSTPSNVAGTGKAVLTLETVEWGRLVDVFDLNGALVAQDVLIRESLQSDGVQYQLGINTLTQSETLTIFAVSGTPSFDNLMNGAASGRTAIVTKGPNSPPTFTRVGRNGAIRMQFSELIDPVSVNRQTIQVQVGGALQEVRYIVKNDEIGFDGKPKGVVILDPTVSELDQANLGIPQNGVGFPPSLDQNDPNIVIHIPTKLDPLFGQTQILMNKSNNHSLSITPSDPTVLSPSFDPIVVRAFRSGNSADPFNGFMLDLNPPKLVTDLPVDVSQITPVGGSGLLRQLTYSITAANCMEITPKVGDLFQIGNAVLLVSRVDDASDPNNYVVTASIVDGSPAAGAGKVSTSYHNDDAALQLCFLKFSPEPVDLPAVEVDPFATVTLNFNEAIDPETVKSLETMVLCSFTLASGNDPTRPFDGGVETVAEYIDRQLGYQTIFDGASVTGSGRIKFGPIEASSDSRSFTLSPLAGMTDAHQEGVNLLLALALRDGQGGILDLAGNQVDAPQFVAGNNGQAQQITLAGATTSWPTDRYFALRANETDENLDGLSEYRGQFTFEPGKLKGRSLNRFSRLADPSNPYVGQRIAFSQGIMTPLTPAGAVLMTVYGYHHLGLGLLSESEFNLDVEGLNWAPFGGTLFDDIFERYSIALAHSKYFPDDYIDPISGYPRHTNSGLVRQQDFTKNILGFGRGEADELIVMDTAYPINSTAKFTAGSGTTMYPWPAFTDTYTWRDTGMSPTLKGSPNGVGVPPDVVGQPQVYAPNQVPSIGSCLLMHFRCYPEGQFFGSNGFQVQIMVGSSALPAFRVFSAGGRDAGNNWHFVVPDVPPDGTKPTGGYNTATGQTTKQFGPELYWGQVDFVTKVSRVTTHFFEFGGPISAISNITLEPDTNQANHNARVKVEFRGSSSLDIGNCAASNNHLNDAISCFEYYGEELNCCTGSSIGIPTDWTTDPTSFLSEPNPPEHFQLRLSFISDLQLDIEAELDAFGFSWNVN